VAVRSASEGRYGAGSYVIHAEAAHSHFVVIPDTELLFLGEFKRSGPDLILTGHDGRHHIVPGYFSSATPPSLVAPNGASLSPGVVDLLAGSPAPARYAQVQPNVSPDPIGKVEKAVGAAIVIRNGVSVALNVGDLVYKGDVVQTGNDSSIGVSFPDGSALNLVADTRMAFNEYSYNANSTSNVALLSLVQGTFAFVAGVVAHTGEMKIVTPVATIGVRGTTGWVREVATVTANVGQVTYSFAVAQDYGTNSHGQYDLIDQNGNIFATVSQPGFVTYVTPQGFGQAPLVSTVPMNNSQVAFEQEIIQQVFQTMNLGPAPPAANPRPDPGGSGSSTPPNDPQPQLIHQLKNETAPFIINVLGTGANDPAPETVTVNLTLVPVPTAAVQWVSHTDGDWSVAANWSDQFVPNDATAVEIALPVTVTVDDAEIANGLAVSGSAILNIVDGGFLTVLGAISNTAVIQLNSYGASAVLAINGTVMLQGGGDLQMLGAADNEIIGCAGTDAVLINIDNIICGAGTIGDGTGNLTLINDAAVYATGQIVLDTGSNIIDNGGVFEAAGGGTLEFNSNINNCGIIQADAGGTLCFDNITVCNTGAIALDGEDDAGSPTELVIAGTLTLQGGDGTATGPGLVTLTDSNCNAIISNGEAATLDNIDNTICGAGAIGDANLTVINEQFGIIDADGNNPLVLDTGANAIVNIGLLEATGGGTLQIDSNVSNFGTLEADGGTLVVDGGVSGSGTVLITGGGIADFAGALSQNVTFSGDGTLALGNPAAFSGEIAGISGSGDVLDLGGFKSQPGDQFRTSSIYNSRTNTTQLTVTDTTDHMSQSVTLVGNYASSNGVSWTATSDGKGGVNVADPPVPVADDGAGGSIRFTDADSTATRTATFTPEGSHRVGPFSFGSASEGNGLAAVEYGLRFGSDQINLAPEQMAAQSRQASAVDGQNALLQHAVSVIGGTGNSKFVFNPGIGAETSIDFDRQHDVIECGKVSSPVLELQSLIADAHGDAVVDLGHGDGGTLPGMTTAQLVAALQSFVHLH
jgi:FecR protein